MRKLPLAAAVAATLSVSAVSISSAQAETAKPVGVPGAWSLVFDDEFNNSSLNTNAWDTHNGWTNQNNVTDSASNVSEIGGNVVLTLASRTSGAAIQSRFATLAVGEYAEARVDFAGSGSTVYDWPAWWTSGPNWPAAGENDIGEGLGTLTVNYHSPTGTHNQGTVPGVWAGGFHTYGIYRTATRCYVYYDGKLVKSYATSDNGQPESLIFTIGAANTLSYGVSGRMLVDYVRVWK